ncbi:MAG: NAD(P)-dependent oxidoreductase, partial [Acidobacteriota bacterium]|nr:NAD(P)-dependent oxidoreductase [Acidobacteriota bacterium]
IGGDFGAGVGVVARHPRPELHARALRFYKMGDGPNYFFFRPYHLVHLEVPRTIAEVCLDREPVAGFGSAPETEVIAVAKRDLHAGEALDGIGGFTAYGLIDTAAGAAGYLPVCLTGFASLIRDVKMDQPIGLDAVRLDEAATPVAEWKRLREIACAPGLSPGGSPR